MELHERLSSSTVGETTERRGDPFAELKNRIHLAVIEDLGRQLFTTDADGEREGMLHKTTVRFTDESQLRRIVNKMVAEVGRRIDEAQPMVDARLPDGSRINAVIPPLSLSGALLTIRKFGAERLDIEALVRLGTLTPDTADLLRRD